MRMNWKRIGILALVLLLTLNMLSACGSEKNEPEATSGQTVSEATSAVTEQNSTPKVDLSAHADLKMYLLGDKPVDADLVYAELNKLIKKDFNASLSVEFIPWSDFETKYTLVLSSGEKVDLIYTSDWSYYVQEATKGAFVEVTDDILKNYMPLTYKYQDKISFQQAQINGKMFCVPKNTAGFAGETVAAIRGDLREKYGLAPIKTNADLEKYLETVAANEKEIFAFAAAGSLGEVKDILLYKALNWIPLYRGEMPYGYTYSNDKEFTADQSQYIYFTPEYLDFAKKMREWSKKGIWSRNAISGKTSTKDSFVNGNSAFFGWELWTVVGAAKDIKKKHPEWKPEVVYGLNPDAISRKDFYTNDCMAVAYTSKYPERSFMLLDKLKNDEAYYKMFVNGIEGKHWVALEGGKWDKGPDFDNYVNNGACQWGVNNDLFKEFASQITDPLEIESQMKAKEIEDFWKTKLHAPITEAFRFDDSKVKTEVASLKSLETKYGYMLDLGMVEDVEKGIEDFKSQAQKAGFDKIMAEIKVQLEEYLKTAK